MPYIKEEHRSQLDGCIEDVIKCLKGNIAPNPENLYGNPYKENITNEEFLSICGDINYTFSRIISSFMVVNPSYAKIAIITGVLENIKQEFYRRAAANLEDQKIRQNGDIPEYRKLSQ